MQFVPLLQTMLWVGLIVWLIFRYHKQIEAVLNAIQYRISHGSAFKAGPFEMGQDVRPQDLEEQNKRIEEEVEELQAATGDVASESAGSVKVTLRERYLLVEDLAMRELQSEFGVIINRSIHFANFELDGLFAKGGAGYGIEVKFIRKRIALDPIVASLEKINIALKRLGWRRFTIILALVADTDHAIGPADIERLQSSASDLGIAIMIRQYTLDGLSGKFGIEL